MPVVCKSTLVLSRVQADAPKAQGTKRIRHDSRDRSLTLDAVGKTTPHTDTRRARRRPLWRIYTLTPRRHHADMRWRTLTHADTRRHARLCADARRYTPTRAVMRRRTRRRTPTHADMRRRTPTHADTRGYSLTHADTRRRTPTHADTHAGGASGGYAPTLISAAPKS
jgi:hypothetical protein